MYRFVVLTNKVDNYLAECRKSGILAKKFVYDFEKYKQEME